MMKHVNVKSIVLIAVLGVMGCATPPPKDQSNICRIFEENTDWYDDAKDMQKRWGTPIPLAMAFVKQESAFVHDAQPPRKYALGFIPWGRISSAYGYSQALDGSWDDYLEATGNSGRRTNFADSLHFIGWYTSHSRKQLGIPMSNAYRHYLAYHEGHGGYDRGSYNKKPQLRKIAKRVSEQSQTYTRQLKSCKRKLDKMNSWWFF